MTRKDISYELFINKNIRYPNFISYMVHSNLYSDKEINSLYSSGKSLKLDLAYLLGTLVLGDLNKANRTIVEKLASNESEFRNKLINSLNSKKNNQIKSILESNQISLENIEDQAISHSFLEFQPKRFIELIVSKSDKKILIFFSKKKTIDEIKMKEYIRTKNPKDLD